MAGNRLFRNLIGLWMLPCLLLALRLPAQRPRVYATNVEYRYCDCGNEDLEPAPPNCLIIDNQKLDSLSLTDAPPVGYLVVFLLDAGLKELPSDFWTVSPGIRCVSLVRSPITQLPPTTKSLDNLQVLRLGSCPLSTIPDLKAPNLKYLELGRYPLTPDFKLLRRYPALQVLRLYECALQEFPREILKLKALREIDMSGNAIRELPAAIWKLPYLQALDISECPVKEFPVPDHPLDSLLSLDISHTNIGALPEDMSVFPNLRYLDCRNSRIAELPASIAQLTNLEMLYLDALPLRDPIETIVRISQLPKLRILSISDIQLDSLPAAIGNLRELGALTIRNCGLKELPPEFAQLINLKAVYPRGNKFGFDYVRSILHRNWGLRVED